jgi:transposase-like protein
MFVIGDMNMSKAPKVQNTSTKGDPTIEALPRACCDEKAAYEFMEKQRWGDHPCCPRCGSLDVYQMKSKSGERQADFRWRCRDCASVNAKAQYTVRTGTVFEESRAELKHWCYAFWRASTSKKGVSALEIKRQTGLTYKASLFMLHRIRYAMQSTPTDKLSGDVEVDELYIGGRPRAPYGDGRKTRHLRKTAVVALVERGGRVRPQAMANVTGQIAKDSSARM